MTALILPASISSLRNATSSCLNGFQPIIRPILLVPASEMRGPRNSDAKILPMGPPTSTRTPPALNARRASKSE